jgi:hypothetical protein
MDFGGIGALGPECLDDLPYVSPYVRAKDERLLDGAGVEATR